MERPVAQVIGVFSCIDLPVVALVYLCKFYLYQTSVMCPPSCPVFVRRLFQESRTGGCSSVIQGRELIELLTAVRLSHDETIESTKSLTLPMWGMLIRRRRRTQNEDLEAVSSMGAVSVYTFAVLSNLDRHKSVFSNFRLPVLSHTPSASKMSWFFELNAQRKMKEATGTRREFQLTSPHSLALFLPLMPPHDACSSQNG